jgi:hypothetical protein
MEGRGFQRWLLLLAVVLAMGWTACGDSGGDKVVTEPQLQNSCIACHLDAAALQLLAVEKEAPEDSGEG